MESSQVCSPSYLFLPVLTFKDGVEDKILKSPLPFWEFKGNPSAQVLVNKFETMKQKDLQKKFFVLLLKSQVFQSVLNPDYQNGIYLFSPVHCDSYLFRCCGHDNTECC